MGLMEEGDEIAVMKGVLQSIKERFALGTRSEVFVLDKEAWEAGRAYLLALRRLHDNGEDDAENEIGIEGGSE